MECLMDHIVLNVEDMEKMVNFYTEVLLVAPERMEEYTSGKVPFPSVRLNPDTVIDLFPKRLWQTAETVGKNHGNLNHFCIVLNKKPWKDLLKRLEESGIRIEEGPVQRWGARGTGTSFYFKDPEENMIEARYYEGVVASEKCLLGS